MKAIHILLVEDNEGDIFLTTEVLKERKIVDKITVKTDGEEAITFFEKLSGNEDWPNLILLDINLPRKSGHEVLSYLKKSERFSYIPVIMLTTSSSKNDILKCYENFTNCYITKPVELVDFIEAINKIEDFWFQIAALPVIK
jgi:CheY-like chemotaxis protein